MGHSSPTEAQGIPAVRRIARRSGAVVVAGIGLALSVAGLVLTKDVIHERTAAEFRAAAEQRVAAIHDRAEGSRKVIEGFSTLFTISVKVNPAKFAMLARVFLDPERSVKALAWSPT